MGLVQRYNKWYEEHLYESITTGLMCSLLPVILCYTHDGNFDTFVMGYKEKPMTEFWFNEENCVAIGELNHPDWGCNGIDVIVSGQMVFKQQDTIKKLQQIVTKAIQEYFNV